MRLRNVLDVHVIAHCRSVGSSVGDWHHHLPLAIEALNAALEGIPPEQVRFHVCWGNYGGPHHKDVPLAEIIELYAKLGDRPIDWSLSQTTTDAILRNIFTHPRTHIAEYYRENGEVERARRVTEQAVDELRTAEAPRLVLGAALYNLACGRVAEGRSEDALALLKEAFPMRPDIKAAAAEDSHLGALRDDFRFQELIKA